MLGEFIDGLAKLANWKTEERKLRSRIVLLCRKNSLTKLQIGEIWCFTDPCVWRYTVIRSNSKVTASVNLILLLFNVSKYIGV